MATAKSRKPPPPPPPLPPFRFGARKDRIDWGALHGVDIERMVCSCVFWGRPHFLRFSSDERDFTRLFPFSFLPSFFPRFPQTGGHHRPRRTRKVRLFRCLRQPRRRAPREALRGKERRGKENEREGDEEETVFFRFREDQKPHRRFFFLSFPFSFFQRPPLPPRSPSAACSAQRS